MALEYLLHCWSEKACQAILTAHEIPQAALDEAQRRSDLRRERIELAGRILHTWDGKDLAADTAALADAIVAANPRLYRIDRHAGPYIRAGDGPCDRSAYAQIT